MKLKLDHNDPTLYTDGQLIKFMSSKLYRNKETFFYLFLPKPISKNERFPVLYLLHGATDSYKAWRENAKDIIINLVNEYRIIIITPDGEEYGWYLDSPFEKNNQISSYIIHELIPFVNINLMPNLVTGKQSIAGLSMGGHGAISLAIKNPTLFESASSMSGILDITLHDDRFEIKKLLGEYLSNKENWYNHSVNKLSENKPEIISKLPLMFTVGDQDQSAIPDNRNYRDTLKKLFQTQLHEQYLDTNNQAELPDKQDKPFIYKEYSGEGHTWKFWKDQLPLHVKWHAQFLK